MLSSIEIFTLAFLKKNGQSTARQVEDGVADALVDAPPHSTIHAVLNRLVAREEAAKSLGEPVDGRPKYKFFITKKGIRTLELLRATLDSAFRPERAA